MSKLTRGLVVAAVADQAWPTVSQMSAPARIVPRRETRPERCNHEFARAHRARPRMTAPQPRNTR
jgi:hypothetical protein